MTIAKTVDRSPFGAMRDLVLAGIALAAPTPAQSARKLTLAIPAPPHAFSALPVLVARQAGFFDHYGVAIELIEMKSAAAATTAVARGTVDLALSPTQFAVQMSANSKKPLKAIWGLDQADWVLASIDRSLTTCAALRGATIGIDARRGPRWTQLNTMMSRGCQLNIGKDFKTVQAGMDLVAAMSLGKLKLAVLHLDEVKAVEARMGKPIHIIATLEAVAPGLHHQMLVARDTTIRQHEPGLQRLVAALSAASKHIVAADAMPATIAIARAALLPSGTAPSANFSAIKAAISALNAMSYFPTATAGLDKSRIEAAIANQVRIGKFTNGKNGIKPGRRAFAYDDIVDRSIWDGALRLK